MCEAELRAELAKVRAELAQTKAQAFTLLPELGNLRIGQ